MRIARRTVHHNPELQSSSNTALAQHVRNKSTRKRSFWSVWTRSARLWQLLLVISLYYVCHRAVLDHVNWDHGQKAALLLPKSHQIDVTYEPLVLPGGVQPRAFPKLTARYNRSSTLPCFQGDEGLEGWQVHREPTDKGFLFVKGKKTGSSTFGTIAVRLAMKEAVRQKKNFTMCNGRWDHPMPTTLNYAERDRKRSVLWSNLREPTKRAISHFFFFVVSKHRKLAPSDENFIGFLNVSFQNQYLQSLDTVTVQWRTNPAASIDNILTEYDFIGITERMEESAVVLMMLWDLKISDILYLNAKGSGAYDDECDFIQPSFVTKRVQQFLDSPAWQNRVKWDLALYKAVNRSLDLTIDQLGRKAFERNLDRFRIAQAKVKEVCKGREVFPCTSDGKRNPKGRDCIWKDSGCGNSCINEAVDILGLEH